MSENQEILRWIAAPKKKGQTQDWYGVDGNGRLRYTAYPSEEYPGLSELYALDDKGIEVLVSVYENVDSAQAAAERLEQEAAEVEVAMENALVLLESAMADERTEMECSCDDPRMACSACPPERMAEPSAWEFFKKWFTGKE